MRFIDLRSDTVTGPTDEMRKAMATAIVGDDVYEDDPTVLKLEKMSAEITGHEAALFTPSGTMANQLAIMAHTRRGDEIILGQNSHIVAHEVGGAAVLSSVSYRIVNNPDDTISGQDIHNAVRESDIHYPDTGLVCLENALSNGTVVPLAKMQEAYNAAKEHNLPVHLDGARLFNAAVYLNVAPKEITKYCTSAMFCLSKGLCSPVGSMLTGSAAFIAKARKYRKLLGGGMRQVGILAASGIISLEKMTKRLHIDHDNATYLAKALAEIPHITLDLNAVHINVVFFKITKDIDHQAFVNHLFENKVRILPRSPRNGNKYRIVMHHDINRDGVDHALKVIKDFLRTRT